MEKKLINKMIFEMTDPKKQITYNRVKDFQFQDGDIIEAGFEESIYQENYSHDGYYYFYVSRDVIETDEEFEIRKKENEEAQERNKKIKYERYLKLKEEFEKINKL